jgi:hypothetical protein
VKPSQRWISPVREAVSPADSDPLDRLAFLMLLAFILSVPWLANAMLTESLAGAPIPIGPLLVPILCFAIGAVSFSSRSPFRSIRPVALPIWSAVALALFGAFQLLPLPDRALQQIAPVNSQIYHEAGEILGLYGQSGPVPRISIAPVSTASSALRIAGYMALLVVTAHLLRTRPRRRAFLAPHSRSSWLRFWPPAGGPSAASFRRGPTSPTICWSSSRSLSARSGPSS